MGDIFGRDEVILYKKDKNDEVPEEKLTLEDEAFRLAFELYPIKANSLLDPPAIIKIELMGYSRSNIIELARIENSKLSEETIIESAMFLSADYIPCPRIFEATDFTEVWFNAEGMRKFLKWCKTSKNNNLLFN